jgi:hypothetical protein
MAKLWLFSSDWLLPGKRIGKFADPLDFIGQDSSSLLALTIQ